MMLQQYAGSNALVIKESGFSTICGISAKYIYEYYRLRADVFRTELGWLGSPSDHIDIDPLDTEAVHFLTLTPQDQVIAAIRLLRSDQKWMFDEYFPCLLPEQNEIHTPDACEVSRLAIHKEWRNLVLDDAITVADLLYKGVFQYCLANKLRYIYMVTTPALVGHLRKKGMPITILEKKTMPDGVLALSAELDWYSFIHQNTCFHPQRMSWYLDLALPISERMAS